MSPPSYTAEAVRILCRFGYTQDAGLQRTFADMMEIQYKDSGWSCNRFSYGQEPETDLFNLWIVQHFWV